jgi:hypothetical protein
VAKAALKVRTIGAMTAGSGLLDYASVRLRHDVSWAGVTYKAGARGVIVHRHADGIGYEVEFAEPSFRVVTLTAQDIQPEHG